MWDVVYAVDASTSMGEAFLGRKQAGRTKIEWVKDGMVEAVKTAAFPYGARIGVVCFRARIKRLGTVDSKSEKAEEILPLTPAAELAEHPDIILDAINDIQVGGATPTAVGLTKAVEVLYTPPEEGFRRIKKVELITDQKSNVGPKPETLLDVAFARRVIVDVVAVGDLREKKAFGVLAAKTGGRVSLVKDPKELAAALDPRIPYSVQEGPFPLLEEAVRLAGVLKDTKPTMVSYSGLRNAADLVRGRTERALKDTLALEGEARANLDLVLAATRSDPKWPRMSMREYSDRVWSRAADFGRLQALEAKYREAIISLSS